MIDQKVGHVTQNINVRQFGLKLWNYHQSTLYYSSTWNHYLTSTNVIFDPGLCDLWPWHLWPFDLSVTYQIYYIKSLKTRFLPWCLNLWPWTTWPLTLTLWLLTSRPHAKWSNLTLMWAHMTCHKFWEKILPLNSCRVLLTLSFCCCSCLRIRSCSLCLSATPRARMSSKSTCMYGTVFH